MIFFAQTWHMTTRLVRRLIRQPWYVALTLIQPIIWLTLYGQLFQRVVDLPGFHATSYIDFLTPGIVIMSALFASGWTGMGVIVDIDRGVMDRFLVSPASQARHHPKPAAESIPDHSRAVADPLRTGRSARRSIRRRSRRARRVAAGCGLARLGIRRALHCIGLHAAQTGVSHRSGKLCPASPHFHLSRFHGEQLDARMDACHRANQSGELVCRSGTMGLKWPRQLGGGRIAARVLGGFWFCRCSYCAACLPGASAGCLEKSRTLASPRPSNKPGDQNIGI